MKPISTSTFTFSDLVGAGFSLKTRNLIRPKIETLP